MNNKVEKWGIYEATFQGPKEGNPFLEVEITAVFKNSKFNISLKCKYIPDKGMYFLIF